MTTKSDAIDTRMARIKGNVTLNEIMTNWRKCLALKI
jgi:hypothetical protein